MSSSRLNGRGATKKVILNLPPVHKAMNEKRTVAANLGQGNESCDCWHVPWKMQVSSAFAEAMLEKRSRHTEPPKSG